MERRYDLLAEVGVRDITGYNAAFDRGDLRARPGRRARVRAPAVHPRRGRRAHDLMMVAARDVEESISRIAADGPCGRHPSRDRHAATVGQRHHRCHQGEHPVAARVRGRLARPTPRSSSTSSAPNDSSGRATCCCSAQASSAAQRIQGSWVEESEVAAIVGQWRKQTPVIEDHYVKGVADEEVSGSSSSGGGSGRRRWRRRRRDARPGDGARGPQRTRVDVHAAAQAARSASPAPVDSWTCSRTVASSVRPRAPRREPS